MKQITVTSPLLPDLDEFQGLLKEIWDSRWITNAGQFHERLESELAQYLGVEYLSLFTNGTLPLITALQALQIKGEVITTPYSFVATSHAVWWNGIKPVFVDIDPVTGNMDPDRIEEAITPATTAIMPVHVYGNPCDAKRIQEIADKYDLKVIYDAAHAFGVRVKAHPNPSQREGLSEPGYCMADSSLYPLLKEYAEENRNRPTQAEAAVWSFLKGNNLGAHFRRQHIIGDYIVDFACLDKKLVIEIDGEYHNEYEQQIDDAQRTAWLEGKGFRVIRFTNLEVLADTDHVIRSIQAALQVLPFGKDLGWASILSAGDISTLSFHATKVYNTIEGGALVCHTKEMKQQIDYLKNFGFEDEVTVVGPGINGKMDEMRSAYGLLNLRQVDAAIEARHQVAIRYREALRDVSGIRVLEDIPGVRHNYAYFPVFVNAEEYGMTRDELYAKLREQHILGRRYFYPLITTFSPYNTYPSASAENLPVATRMANEVICLPMHHALSEEDVDRVIDVILNKR